MINLDSSALKAATSAVKEELADYPDVRQSSWNIAGAAVRAYLEALPSALDMPGGAGGDLTAAPWARPVTTDELEHD